MSIHLGFDAHIRDAVNYSHQAHLAVLRAAQLHDEEPVTIVLREVVHNLAVAREQLDILADVKRPQLLPPTLKRHVI